MPLWLTNTLALGVGTLAMFAFALAMFWRVGSWRISSLHTLSLDHGLAEGTEAPEIAAHRGETDIHLSFGGQPSFILFGSSQCQPCLELLAAASTHPATRPMRLIYLAESEDVDVDPDRLSRWEVYRFHDELRSRTTWRAPVSPYFHVIDSNNRVIAKGVANKTDHLDRLLELAPESARNSTQGRKYGRVRSVSHDA